jgi:hypothetical protein
VWQCTYMFLHFEVLGWSASEVAEFGRLTHLPFQPFVQPFVGADAIDTSAATSAGTDSHSGELWFGVCTGFGPATSRAMAALAYHWEFGYSSTTLRALLTFLVCRAEHRLLALVAGLPTDPIAYTDEGTW